MIKVIIMITKIIVAATIALFLNSCNIKTDFGEEGNGTITTNARIINEDFKGIDVGAGIEVTVKQANNQFVSVETDSNLQSLIETKVVDGVLVIKPTQSVDPTSTIKVVVKMANIESLDASSGSEIVGMGAFKGENIVIHASSAAEIDVNVRYDNVNLDASSGANITAKGVGLKLETNASSGSEINAFDLLVNDIVADASSGSNTNVHPILKLSATASSGSNIMYNNKPKSISKDQSSGGNIDLE